MRSKNFITEGFIEDAHQVAVDHEVQMSREELYHAAENAIVLHKLLRHVSEAQGLEAWVSSKITLANDYLKTVREYLEYELMTMNSNDPTVVDNTQLPIAEGVAEGTGDVKFDNMLKGITAKKAVAKQRKADPVPVTKGHFADKPGQKKPYPELWNPKTGKVRPHPADKNALEGSDPYRREISPPSPEEFDEGVAEQRFGNMESPERTKIVRSVIRDLGLNSQPVDHIWTNKLRDGSRTVKFLYRGDAKQATSLLAKTLSKKGLAQGQDFVVRLGMPTTPPVLGYTSIIVHLPVQSTGVAEGFIDDMPADSMVGTMNKIRDDAKSRRHLHLQKLLKRSKNPKTIAQIKALLSKEFPQGVAENASGGASSAGAVATVVKGGKGKTNLLGGPEYKGHNPFKKLGKKK